MDLRVGIKSISHHRGLHACGSKVISKAGVSVMAGGTAGAGLGGLATCGSVWVCPVCSAKVATKRAQELGTILDLAIERGHSVALFTFTVQHKRHHSLKQVWDAVQGGWHSITSGARWKSMMREQGVVGWVRAVEVTLGDNGWHVHIHVPVILDGDGIALGHEMWERWLRGIKRQGFDAIKDKGGFDVQIGSDAVTAIGHYLVKQQMAGETLHKQTGGDIAREAVHGQQKSGRLGGRTPFQLAQSVLESTDERRRVVELALWRQWEAGSLGRRQMAWSKGLREWAALQPELSDAELAAEEADGETLVLIPKAGWRMVMRKRGLDSWILDEAELNGFAGVRDLLDAFGIPWHTPAEAAAAAALADAA